MLVKIPPCSVTVIVYYFLFTVTVTYIVITGTNTISVIVSISISISVSNSVSVGSTGADHVCIIVGVGCRDGVRSGLGCHRLIGIGEQFVTLVLGYIFF